MIKAIDIHCHFNHGSLYDTKESDDYHCNLDFLIKERERLDIKACALTTFASVLSTETIEEENDYFHTIVQKNPFVWQWVVIDPRKKRTFEQAKEMMKSPKTLGIKIHPSYHKYSIAEYADKIFSFADEWKCVVLMHPDNMGDTLKYANKYPNMKLIVAHLGTNEEYIRIIQEAKPQNIYTDTSGMASFKNNVIENTVRAVGSEKILFGTDSYSCAFQRGRIDYADISEKDKENIFFRNALKLFPVLQDANI